jgi:hypothetical protein
MNIFYLDRDPQLAAQMMHDKHVVKMILESAQILSTVCHRHGLWQENMYKPTHAQHPSVLWAGDGLYNFTWLVTHARALAAEYAYRYAGKEHRSLEIIYRAAAAARGAEMPLLWTEPPQAMPDEFKIAGNSVAAYRAYYLGRKVMQSGWTRRPVPAFVTEGKANMAKKQVERVEAPTPAAEDAPRAMPLTRGPKGAAMDALITLNVETNPKRPGSKAFDAFSHYRSGMTVQEYLEAAGKAATPNLVYDSAHGFISIEGYEPKEAPKRTPKEPKAPKPPKAEKEPKAPKEPKARKAKPTIIQAVESPEVESLTVEETID